MFSWPVLRVDGRSFSDTTGGPPIAGDITSHQFVYETNNEKRQGIQLFPLFYVIFRPLT